MSVLSWLLPHSSLLQPMAWPFSGGSFLPLPWRWWREVISSGSHERSLNLHLTAQLTPPTTIPSSKPTSAPLVHSHIQTILCLGTDAGLLQVLQTTVGSTTR